MIEISFDNSDKVVLGVTWGSPAQTLNFAISTLASNAAGGPKIAEIQVTGPTSDLWDCFNWMRRPVEVRSHGELVWWGFVNSARLSTGFGEFGCSFDHSANRIKVTYSQPGDSGSNEYSETEWYEDLESQARFGIKELIFSMGTAYQPDADAKAANLLENSSEVVPTATSLGGQSGGDSLVVLECLGPVELLKWTYYTRESGRFEYAPDESSTRNPIGWRITSSNSIGITKGKPGGLHDFNGQLGALSPGVRVRLSGLPRGDGFYKIVSSPQDAVEYAGNVHFQRNDDIYSDEQGFGNFTPGGLLKISQSSSNDGYDIISSVTPGYMTTVETISGAIVDEADNPVLLQQAQMVKVESCSVYEPPQNTVLVSIPGDRIAQSLTPTDDMQVGQIWLKVCRIGSPIDLLRLQVYTGSSSPTTLIATSTRATNLLPVENPTWSSFDFTPFPMTAGIQYWLVIDRTGDFSTTDYFILQSAAEAHDTTLGWNWDAWMPIHHGEAIPYKVWATENVSTSIGFALEASPFVANVWMEDVSLVSSHPYRDQPETIFDAVSDMLSTSYTDQRQLWYTFGNQWSVRVWQEPVRPLSCEFMLDEQGRLLRRNGQVATPWTLPAGQWIEVLGVPLNFPQARFVFAEDVSTADGLTYTIQPKRLFDDVSS